MKILRDNLCLVSEAVIESSLKIDARKLSDNPPMFADQNRLGYYVGINTWLLIFKEFSEYGWTYVADRIRRFGFVQVIGEFSETAQKLVEGDSSDIPRLHANLIEDFSQNLGRKSLHDGAKNVGDTLFATTQQVFRYPKRFTPIGADTLRRECLDGFVARQNRLKLLQRREHSRFVVELVRAEIFGLYDWDKVCDEIESLDLSDLTLTHGVGYDANAFLGSKLRALYDSCPDYFNRWCFSNQRLIDTYVEENDVAEGAHVVTIRAVPKSYKAYRIIAMENTFRQSFAKSIFHVMDNHSPAGIDLHDQGKNQECARDGSIFGCYATLDLSNASDDATRTHVVELYPARFVALMDRIAPTFYELDGKTRLLHSYATMGNAMTFINECNIFLGVALAATRFVSLFLNEDLLPPRTFGDDIIVDTRAAITTMEFLETLGFTVNREKSFYQGSYRESCGAEYFKGEDVSIYFFPRAGIQGTYVKGRPSLSDFTTYDGFTEEYEDSTTRLVSLHNRLYNFCKPAALLVREIVLECHPKMTFSCVGDTTSSDLWSYEDTYLTGKAPHSKDLVPTEKGGPDITRRYKYTPVVEYANGSPKKGQVVPEDVYDRYRYNMFLKYGPSYETDLDKLLHVTRQDRSYSEICSRAKVKWKRTLF